MAVKLFKRCSRRSPLPCILASASFILLWTLCSSSPSSSSSLSSSLSSSSTLEGDLKALVEFKTSIEDPHDYLADWVGVDPCSWRGVACSSPFTASNSSSTSSSSNSSSRVVKLELASVDLAGAPCIPCLLSSLQYLQALDLSSNAFSGNLSSLQSCYDIAAFNLSSNRFGGAIPSNLLTLCTHLEVLDLSSNAFSEPLDNALFSSCPALTSLDFSSNKLEGAIPPSIGWCLSLQTLDLSHNNINGSIPATFGSLRAIRKLNLAGNAISGEIPPDLSGACATLLELDLSANAISGTIPATLAKCSSLQVLNLARNSLFGPFPESIVANLHSATKLLFELNSFTGPVPVTVTANCTNLKVLDLNSNGLSGAIPDELCLPTTIALEELRLKNNKLHGNIPAALSNCTRLKVLDLSYNLLYGEIPAELTWLSDMEILSIWYNGLSGKLPPEFGAMPKLRTLVLNNNYLSGSIPVEIANCSSLEWISLSNNALSGVIPTQIGQLGRLALLELANNSLSGELPSELGNCSYLLWLDVHNNELSGNIPSRLGRFDDGPPATLILSGDHVAFLRHLEFTCSGLGSLVEFSGMSEAALNQTPLMQSCTSVRLYDGPTLNDNPDYTTIQYVDLSRNHFTGTIPMHLGHMRALQMLDLSHNHLSGPIPTTFAHLLHLGVVDISHNALNGSLWPLTNCTFLVQLDVSYNNFSGTIPSMGQLSTASESNFAGNPFLCGPPLLTCGLSSPPARACTAGTPSCLKPKAPMVTSWVNNVVLGVLISMAFLGLLLFWALIIRAKKKSKDTAAMLMLGSLHSSSCRRVGKNNSTTTGGSSSNWNLSGEREPLSINVATFERPLRKLTFSQLIEATNGFTSESLIGTGGFGEVYKATLKDGSIVAIKKLVQCSYQGDREFIAEMETLGKIKHRNLVPLLGYCKVGEERLLVYEYMHGGSLDDLLHSGVNRPWEVRKQIAKGAARGLAFLHHNCIPHIIHRDMKSSNVLLDQNLEARVSDFGMARLISALDTHLSVSTLAGTPGYVPPEYYQSFRCTAKGDVYSFGVVLLELLTGKRPTDKEEFGDSNLVGWVKVEVKQGRGVEVLDLDLTSGYLLEPKLANIATIEGYPVGTPVHEEMMKYLRIACECVDDLPSRRPTMLEVVARFKEIAAES